MHMMLLQARRRRICLQPLQTLVGMVKALGLVWLAGLLDPGVGVVVVPLVLVMLRVMPLRLRKSQVRSQLVGEYQVMGMLLFWMLI